MRKTIQINGINHTLNATGITLVKYKDNFCVEYFDDLRAINALISTKADTKLINTKIVETGLRLTWCMADIKDDFETFVHSIECSVDFITDVQELFMKSLGTDTEKDSKNDEPFSSENFIACCNMCGFDMSDIKSMSIGFLLKTIHKYSEIKSGTTERKSNQTDINKLFGRG